MAAAPQLNVPKPREQRAASPMDVKLKTTGLMPPQDPKGRGKRGKSPLSQPSIVTLNLPEGDRGRSKTPDILSEEEIKKKRERIAKMEEEKKLHDKMMRRGKSPMAPDKSKSPFPGQLKHIERSKSPAPPQRAPKKEKVKKIHVPLVLHQSPLAPHFKQKPEGLQLYEGDEGEVEFVVDGNPFPDVVIMKGTRALVSGVHHHFGVDKVTGVVNFVIKKAKNDDEGKYVVKLKQKGGKEESAIFNVFVKAEGGLDFREQLKTTNTKQKEKKASDDGATLKFQLKKTKRPDKGPKDKWDIPLENKDAHEDDGKLKLTCEFWKPQVQSDGTRTKRNCHRFQVPHGNGPKAPLVDHL